MLSPIGRKARELGPGYSVEVDAVNEASWHRILEEFNDANIYQTWSYGEVLGGRGNVSHVVLEKDGEVVAAAQARIVKLPVVAAGIAYVRWGPLWRRRALEPDIESFRQVIRALRNEYACKRGLVLRLRPALFRECGSEFASILAEEGYRSGPETAERTLRLDLTKSAGDLRKGMRPHWRRYLNVAEKGDLEITEGSAGVLFDEFVGIYRELVNRKAFAEPNDIRKFRSIQERLPQNLKMKILLCKAEGKLRSGLICSAIGDTAIYLYGATSNAGLKIRGSYLLHWKLIEWLKETGIATYDLHGINPATNPGTYKFKADLCGSNGRDVHFLGQFDAHASALSHTCVALGDRLRQVAGGFRRKEARNPMPVPASAPESIPHCPPPPGATKADKTRHHAAHQHAESDGREPYAGLLIVNADDWGRDRLTTDRILDCCLLDAVSSVSAMVFMEDSERAAAIARERGIEAGLHLNFTTPFSGGGVPAGLVERQQQIARHLSRHRLAQVVFHPGLVRSFEYVALTQFDEFCRLYGAAPDRIDGHHHMHLCANVLIQKLLPLGTMVRRNFSFDRGEKSLGNHLYRSLVDRSLARHHQLTDYFFSLPPLEPASRLQRIFALAGQFTVEVETHPVNPEEHRYLSTGEIFRQIGDVRVARPSAMRQRAEGVR